MSTRFTSPVFRFAPSPNGPLHLGHALSAILNHDMANKYGGRLLLRIEDIDQTRCTPEFEQDIRHDLEWLGLKWNKPVRRQSEHFEFYAGALQELQEMGLIYPSFMTRGEVKALVSDYEAHGKSWPRDPDGVPLYPPQDRNRSVTERQALITRGLRHAWRLDIRRAIALLKQPLSWIETGNGEMQTVKADPARWGDVILSRSDAPSSYHLSVTLDDALQGITHVVRGQDLFEATSVQRLLQELLELPQPVYHHHRLITDETGRKLSKSEGSPGLAALRNNGLSPIDIRRLVGL